MLKEKKKSLKLWIMAVLMILLILSLNSCASYDPSIYHSAYYDVLEPSDSVRIVGVCYIVDGEIKIAELKYIDRNPNERYIIVNKAFILWVDELKYEIKQLRVGE
ncbi:hypothetical protein CMI37_30895 [Candidatus Pacearchaeota archaeon]|nr:hypothetical protein [Candidatus Pacearchaeota archaeon]